MVTLQELKDHHKTQMDMYAENIRSHVKKYGSEPCDYLIHRQVMEAYHRGAWNALNEAEALERSNPTC